MNVAILGPHGSGNRLVARMVRHYYPDAATAVRSFPVYQHEHDLTRHDFDEDCYLINLREVSPWCMVRERRREATSVEVAHELVARGFKQIYNVLGPFWERDDVALIRYRGIIDAGPEYAAIIMSKVMPISQEPPFDETIVDGDEKYEVGVPTLSLEQWIDRLKGFCE